MSAEQQEHLVKTAFLFPGQGSQKIGMLADIASAFTSVQETFTEASDALSLDLWHIAQTGDSLDQTQNTQPVLLTASIALWRLWLELGGELPQYLAGHSLGEYSALVAAQSLSLADAVKLVHVRGKLMQNAVPSGEGAMAAILGLSDEAVVKLCQSVSEDKKGVVEAANYNAQGQVVIAGSIALVNEVIESVKQNAGKAIALPVSVPSHCSLMRSAADQFALILEETTIQLPKIPVIQNVNADVSRDIDQVRQTLITQLYQSVQWTRTMHYLQQKNVHFLVECGPGTVLTNLAKRLPAIEKAFSIDTSSRMQEGLKAISSAMKGKNA